MTSYFLFYQGLLPRCRNILHVVPYILILYQDFLQLRLCIDCSLHHQASLPYVHHSQLLCNSLFSLLCAPVNLLTFGFLLWGVHHLLLFNSYLSSRATSTPYLMATHIALLKGPLHNLLHPPFCKLCVSSHRGSRHPSLPKFVFFSCNSSIVTVGFFSMPSFSFSFFIHNHHRFLSFTVLSPLQVVIPVCIFLPLLLIRLGSCPCTCPSSFSRCNCQGFRCLRILTNWRRFCPVIVPNCTSFRWFK